MAGSGLGNVRARLIALDHDLKAEGFMRTLQVVDVPPTIELPLAMTRLRKRGRWSSSTVRVRWKRLSLP